MHERALELSRSLGVAPDPRLLYSLLLASLSRNEFDAARTFGEQLHRLGEDGDDDVIRAHGGYVLGITAFWGGDLAGARDWFERAIACCRPEHRAAHILHCGHDPESTCLTRLGCTLWLLGSPVSAVRARERTFAVVAELRDTYSRTLTLMFAALLALEMREPERMRALIAELQGISSDRPHVLATARH